MKMNKIALSMSVFFLFDSFFLILQAGFNDNVTRIDII